MQYLSLLLQQLVLLPPLPLELLLLLFLVPPFEDLQLAVGALDLVGELPDLGLQPLLALLDLGRQLLAFLLDVGVLPDQVLLELLVDERLRAVGGLDVLDVREEGLLCLVKPAGVVGYLCLAFLGEVGYLDLCLLLDLHELLLDFLDLGHVLCDLLVVLLLLEVFLLLGLLDVDVEVLLLFQQLPQLVLVLQLVGDECVELLGGPVLYELD